MTVDGVVLAAGSSRRFAESVTSPSMPRLKQLLDFGGETLVRRTVRTALMSKLSRVIVVVGCGAETVRKEICDLGVDIVVNPAWSEGQSTTVRAGLGAVDPEADAVIFIPCDQPFLGAGPIDRLIETRATRRTSILAASFERGYGAPVLFGRELFGELATIEGDRGGRQLFELHTESFSMVELDDPLPLADVDSVEDYEALLERLG